MSRLDQPVGSKWLAEARGRALGPLDGAGGARPARGRRAARASPHVRGPCPTDRGYRIYVDEIISEGGAAGAAPAARAVDDAARARRGDARHLDAAPQVTNLLALVTAPRPEAAPSGASRCCFCSRRSRWWSSSPRPGRHQARDLVRPARRPGSRRLGGQLSERGGRRPRHRLGLLAMRFSDPELTARERGHSRRSPPPSPSSTTAPSTWTALRGCSPSSASKRCRSSAH